mmetsp:Transcript_49125/g.154216  ORF Transcript_49125/g.154216 Transcript_49125/m.154216 type:complete len:805 (-) Transcript_49125:35-2449(-)
MKGSDMEETWLYQMSPSDEGLMYLRNVKTDVIVELSGKRSSEGSLALRVGSNMLRCRLRDLSIAPLPSLLDQSMVEELEHGCGESLYEDIKTKSFISMVQESNMGWTFRPQQPFAVFHGPLKVQLIVLPGGLLLLPATGDGAIRVEDYRIQLVDRKEEEMELHLSNVLRWLPCSRCDVDMEGLKAWMPPAEAREAWQQSSPCRTLAGLAHTQSENVTRDGEKSTGSNHNNNALRKTTVNDDALKERIQICEKTRADLRSSMHMSEDRLRRHLHDVDKELEEIEALMLGREEGGGSNVGSSEGNIATIRLEYDRRKAKIVQQHNREMESVREKMFRYSREEEKLRYQLQHKPMTSSADRVRRLKVQRQPAVVVDHRGMTSETVASLSPFPRLRAASSSSFRRLVGIQSSLMLSRTVGATGSDTLRNEDAREFFVEHVLTSTRPKTLEASRDSVTRLKELARRQVSQMLSAVSPKMASMSPRQALEFSLMRRREGEHAEERRAVFTMDKEEFVTHRPAGWEEAEKREEATLSKDARGERDSLRHFTIARSISRWQEQQTSPSQPRPALSDLIRDVSRRVDSSARVQEKVRRLRAAEQLDVMVSSLKPREGSPQPGRERVGRVVASTMSMVREYLPQLERVWTPTWSISEEFLDQLSCLPSPRRRAVWNTVCACDRIVSESMLNISANVLARSFRVHKARNVFRNLRVQRYLAMIVRLQQNIRCAVSRRSLTRLRGSSKLETRMKTEVRQQEVPQRKTLEESEADDEDSKVLWLVRNHSVSEDKARQVLTICQGDITRTSSIISHMS